MSKGRKRPTVRKRDVGTPWAGILDMRRRFAEEYVRDFNGGAAAVRAGYAPKAAREIAYKVGRDPKVRAYIEHLQEERSERLQLDIDDVVRELWRLAMSTVGSVATWKGNRLKLKDSDELSPAAMASIAEVIEHVNEDGGRTLRVKQHGKHDALKTLLVYLDSRRGSATAEFRDELIAALREHYGMAGMIDATPGEMVVEALPADATKPDGVNGKGSNGHGGNGHSGDL